MDRRTLLPLLALALLACGCTGTGGAYQKRMKRTLAPAQIESARIRPAAEARPMRARIYCDAEYRSGVLWRSEVQDLLDEANAILVPQFGVRLVASELVAWQREAPADDNVAMLREIDRLDDGSADWAIGLTAGIPIASSNIETLGAAWLLDRSFLCRAIDDRDDVKELEHRRLKDKERAALVQARVRHRALVVFLHEWAHSLGLPHLAGQRNLMNPTYDRQQSTFGEEGKALLEIALRHRLERSRDTAARDRELLGYLEAHPTGPWIPAARAELLERLRSGAAPRPAALAPADARTMALASEAQRAGRLDEAWRLAAPVASRNPGHAAAQLWACQLAAARAAPLAGEREPCDRAVALEPQSAAARIALGWVLYKEDVGEAVRVLDEALATLAAAPQSEAETWAELGRLATRLGAVSAAEEIAARSEAAGRERLLDWARHTRRRSGLPAQGGPARREEGAYVRAYDRALALFGESRFTEAERHIAEALERFPLAPGLLALRCGLAGQRRQPRQARALCERALALHEECVQAHYFLGLLDRFEKRSSAARAHFGRVIELIPEIEAAWRQLDRVLLDAGKAAERAELEGRYRARFGRAL